MNNNTTKTKPFIFLESASICGNTGLMINSGQVLPELIGCETGGISVHGSIITYIAAMPNMLEIEKRELSEGAFKARVAYVNGEIFVLLKFGSLPWSVIAYTPHLGGYIDLEELPEQYLFSIIPVEGTTGKVQGIRFRTASMDFTTKFNKLIKRQFDKPFCLQQYYENVIQVFNRYTTKQLLKFAL